MDVFEKIRAQQPAQRTAAWMVGEQLADIIRHDPAAQEIVVVGGVEPQITVKGAWETTRKRLNKMVTGALKLLELYLHAYMQDHMEYEAAREGGREA